MLVSSGRSRQYLVWGLCEALLACISFVVGLPFGIEGVAAAYALATYLAFIPSLLYCFHNTPVTTALFLKSLVPPLLASMLAAGGGIAAKYATGGASIGAHLLSLAVFAGVYAGLSCRRRIVREMVGLLRRRLPVVAEGQPGDM